MPLTGRINLTKFRQDAVTYFNNREVDPKPMIHYTAGDGETIDSIYGILDECYGNGQVGTVNDEYRRNYYEENRQLSTARDLRGRDVKIPFYLVYVGAAHGRDPVLAGVKRELETFHDKVDRWTFHAYRRDGRHGFVLMDPGTLGG